MKKIIAYLLFLFLITIFGVMFAYQAPASANGNTVSINGITNDEAIDINQTTIDGDTTTNLTVTNDSENYDIIMTNVIDQETGFTLIAYSIGNDADGKYFIIVPPVITTSNEWVTVRYINGELVVQWILDRKLIEVIEQIIPSLPNDSKYTIVFPQDIDDEYVVIESCINGEINILWYRDGEVALFELHESDLR